MRRIAEKIETDELCSYGCGDTARYINVSGKLMCKNSHNSCAANRKTNSDNLTAAYKTGVRKNASEIYASLDDETKERMNWNKGNRYAIFEYNGKGQHKNALLSERGHSCESCGLSEWLNKPITIELEHTDGDRKNNCKENLKLLCPNCHSQTLT